MKYEDAREVILGWCSLLKNARDKNGMSVGKFVEKLSLENCDINDITIYRFEASKNLDGFIDKIWLISKYMDYFNVSVDELCDAYNSECGEKLKQIRQILNC